MIRRVRFERGRGGRVIARVPIGKKVLIGFPDKNWDRRAFPPPHPGEEWDVRVVSIKEGYCFLMPVAKIVPLGSGWYI